MLKNLRCVFDASTLIMYFEKQRNYAQVAAILKDAFQKGQLILLSVINLGEVYYIYRKRAGAVKAEEILTRIQSLPIRFEAATFPAMKQAAAYKSSTTLSYVDCYAAALAKLTGLELVTADKEFLQLKGEIKIVCVN